MDKYGLTARDIERVLRAAKKRAERLETYHRTNRTHAVVIYAAVRMQYGEGRNEIQRMMRMMRLTELEGYASGKAAGVQDGRFMAALKGDAHATHA